MLAGFFLAASGCASLASFAGRHEAADRIARAAGFRKIFIETKDFVLTAYLRASEPGGDLTVYIEGDGAAWLTRRQLSADPTPGKPLVLELAAMDPAANVAYLARPGQYTAGPFPVCDPIYWSARRFSKEVVKAMNEAVDRLRADAGSRRLNLIGYSGGAAIAVLIASGRSDVVSLRTVAGNLDTEAVNRYHGVSPLEGSLNPIHRARKLKYLPQHHFAGSADTVVPPFITESFAKQTGDEVRGKMTIIEGATHGEGWKARWRSLLAVPFQEP